MPEARLQRTREVYDEPFDYEAWQLENLLEFARRLSGPITNEMRPVTDDRTGDTLQVRIPRRFEVRR